MLLAVLGIATAMTGPLFGQEPRAAQDASEAPFDPAQPYEVFFRLHPEEIDRLSNVRLLGTSRLGGKTFLHFQTLLNNQLEEGWIELESISAILPSSQRFVSAPEILLDRQRLDEKVKEVRSEVVREVIKESPGAVIVPAAPRRH